MLMTKIDNEGAEQITAWGLAGTGEEQIAHFQVDVVTTRKWL